MVAGMLRMSNSKISKYEKVTPYEPTANCELSTSLEFLFRSLNRHLIEPFLRDGKGFKVEPVPDCILCAESRLKRYRGFIANAAWSDKHGRKLDQITIVFNRGRPLDIKGLASTLVHEMIHATQFRDGTIGNGNYHNADFRDRMRSVGLQTSQTGEPGGADIGTSMTHYIIEGGPFDWVMDAVIAVGFSFPIEVNDPYPQPPTIKGKAASEKRKDPSKAKFFCPRCGQIARAKRTASLKCGSPSCANNRMLLDW